MSWLDISISKNSIISMNSYKPSNDEIFFLWIPNDFVKDISVFLYVLNLVNELEIAFNRNRAVFSNSFPYLLNKTII